MPQTSTQGFSLGDMNHPVEAYLGEDPNVASPEVRFRPFRFVRFVGGESVPTGLVWPSPEAEEKLREALVFGRARLFGQNTDGREPTHFLSSDQFVTCLPQN